MEVKQSASDEAKFPYYALRETVWPLKERRRILWVSGAWCVLAALFGAYAVIAAGQQEQTVIQAIVVAITLGIGAFITNVARCYIAN